LLQEELARQEENNREEEVREVLSQIQGTFNKIAFWGLPPPPQHLFWPLQLTMFSPPPIEDPFSLKYKQKMEE
jgi:hypothetical protein